MNSDTAILFIHGMFLNGKSWEQWVSFFETRGYRCLTPSWPFHEGDPADLRAYVPAELARLDLATLVEFHADIIAEETAKPIVIGHSLGGLIAQELVIRGVAAAAVCLGSAAPSNLIAIDWGFLKNCARIANPIKGDGSIRLTEEAFHTAFGNAMSREDSARAYYRYVVPESRNVLRDAMGAAGRIDASLPHAPLLFLGGAEDQIVPAELNQRQGEAYSDPGSITEFHEFAGRGHFICGEPGWEEVAGYIAQWLENEQAWHGENSASGTLRRRA